MMAVIFLRMIAELLAGLVAFAGGLILVGIGQTKEAVSLLVVCGIVAWFIRPDAEQREEFRKFQESRAKYPTR